MNYCLFCLLSDFEVIYTLKMSRFRFLASTVLHSLLQVITLLKLDLHSITCKLWEGKMYYCCHNTFCHKFISMSTVHIPHLLNISPSCDDLFAAKLPCCDLLCVPSFCFRAHFTTRFTHWPCFQQQTAAENTVCHLPITKQQSDKVCN